MSENAAAKPDAGMPVNSTRDQGGVVLLFLLLLYSLVSVYLDGEYPIPKPQILSKGMTIGYVLVFLSTMFLLCYRIIPEYFTEFVPFLNSYEKYILVTMVFMTAIMLSLNIKAGGGIRSPYVPFLSSFPVFFMVLLFEKVNVKSCIKGALIAFGSLAFVYAVDFLLVHFLKSGIAVSSRIVEAFLGSPAYVALAVTVLVITALSNLLSLYFGARQEA